MQWIKKLWKQNKTIGSTISSLQKLMATFAEKYDYLVKVSQIRNIYIETVIWLKKWSRDTKAHWW